MAKRDYKGMVMTRAEVEPEMVILKGSKTSVPIKINSVEVESYKQGFGTTISDDFQEISFD